MEQGVFQDLSIILRFFLGTFQIGISGYDWEITRRVKLMDNFTCGVVFNGLILQIFHFHMTVPHIRRWVKHFTYWHFQIIIIIRRKITLFFSIPFGKGQRLTQAVFICPNHGFISSNTTACAVFKAIRILLSILPSRFIGLHGLPIIAYFYPFHPRAAT